MVAESVVDLSRFQFAATAMYHFLFVPLTLGLSWILLIMESVYVMTGKVTKPAPKRSGQWWRRAVSLGSHGSRFTHSQRRIGPDLIPKYLH